MTIKSEFLQVEFGMGYFVYASLIKLLMYSQDENHWFRLTSKIDQQGRGKGKRGQV